MIFPIDRALTDPNLLAGFIQTDSWGAWLTCWRSVFALPPQDGDLELFKRCTGRDTWPTDPAKEIYIIAGRRSGKSHNASLLACYLAAFREYPLAKGEQAVIGIVSPTKQQARIIKQYANAPFRENPLLQPLVLRETAYEVELTNGVSIMIMPADQRSTRGFTAAAVILDESAFFSIENARSDIEIVRSWRPALATLGGILVAISSPYAKSGHLYNMWKQHYGKDGDTLVWVADSRTMNPTLSERIIAKALAEDPEAAAAEWNAEWRSDIESYISREAVEACVVPGRFELPYHPKHSYKSFCDPSGGSQDSMTICVAHKEGEITVLDALREVKPPFQPDDVVNEFSSLLKSYRISSCVGDRYGGIWPTSRFQAYGIRYEVGDKVKSDLYRELLPMLNAGRVELLDNEKLVNQIVGLERRVSRGGRDSIDHPQRSHDDLANVLAGAAFILSHRSSAVFPELSREVSYV